MGQQNKNKEFIIGYFNAINGVAKTKELLEEFTTDEELMNHIAFFDTVFPKYEMFADEIIAEGNKVVVRARCRGAIKVAVPFTLYFLVFQPTDLKQWLLVLEGN